MSANTSIVPQSKDRLPMPKSQEIAQVEDDFDYARDNIYGIIKKGQDALDKMLEIADQSQHPAAYETLTKMLKVQSEMSKTLLRIHAQKKEVKEDTQIPQQQAPQQKLDVQGDVVQNKTVYASTDEIAKMLSGEKEDDAN